VLLGALMLACAPPPVAIEVTCQVEPLALGELIARRIACKDEIAPSGESDIGDWILANSQIRFGIRDATQSLTRLQGTGGTIVDVALPEGTDFIIEAIPFVDGIWFDDATVSAWTGLDEAGIAVSGILQNGRHHTVTYVLAADSTGLELRGANVLELVPMTRSSAVGDTLETPADEAYVVLAGDGPMADDGGWVRWTGIRRWWVGERAAVYRGLWPDGRPISGTSDGSWVYVQIDDSSVSRTAVENGAFDTWIPRDADVVVSVRSGHDQSPKLAPDIGADLPVGASGFIALEVTDDRGNPVPATLTWGGSTWSWLPGNTALGVGPGVGSGSVDAGPAYEIVDIPEQDITGEVAISVTVPTAVTPALLARLDVLASPDRTERRSTDSVLRQVAASGVGFAVVVADDEVALASAGESTADWIRYHSGSRADSDMGRPVAWPWSPVTSRPAHGAAPWTRLDPQELLAVMNQNGGRWSAIDAEWAEAAGDPAGWSVQPEVFRLDDFEDRAAYQALLDAWQPLSPIGPLTWVDGVDLTAFANDDAMRGILTGRTTATTGPRILLTVDGRTPGQILEPVAVNGRQIEIVVEAAERFTVTTAALYGPRGEELARWPLYGKGPVRLRATTWLSEVDYLIAAVWNDLDPISGDWAITGPIWGGRP
jgi:hypothetical protein